VLKGLKTATEANGEWYNLTPALLKPISRSSPKLHRRLRREYLYTLQNFIQLGSGVSFPRMRNSAIYEGGRFCLSPTTNTSARILT